MTFTCIVPARRASISKVSAKDRKLVERIRELAGKQNVKIARGFIEAVERARDEIDLDQIIDLLTAGRTGAAQQAINDAIDRAAFTPVTRATRAAVTAGGDMAAALASEFLPRRLEVVFDVANPGTSEFLRRYQASQIRELTQETRRVVRQALIDGIENGRNPLDTARDVRASIGLTQQQDRAVRNFRRMLEEGDREALTRDLRDRRFDSALRRMSETPLSREQIDRMVERYRERYLKYRSETIARTESIRAVQAGQHELWRQNVQNGTFDASQVTRSWVYTADNRVRDWHASIPDMNPDGVGLEEPFDTELGPLMYPGDPAGVPANVINCRCAVVMHYAPTLVD